MTEIRPITELDHQAILEIVASLPEWFNDHERNHAIPADLKHQQGFVAESDGCIVGFITLAGPDASAQSPNDLLNQRTLSV